MYLYLYLYVFLDMGLHDPLNYLQPTIHSTALPRCSVVINNPQFCHKTRKAAKLFINQCWNQPIRTHLPYWSKVNLNISNKEIFSATETPFFFASTNPRFTEGKFLKVCTFEKPHQNLLFAPLKTIGPCPWLLKVENSCKISKCP